MRFADVGRATRDRPDFASLHPASQAEIASTNSWSGFSWGLLATAND
jgi:hypothetical protein